MTKTAFDIEEYCDDLGPIKIVHVHNPACGLRGIVAIDNVHVTFTARSPP